VPGRGRLQLAAAAALAALAALALGGAACAGGSSPEGSRAASGGETTTTYTNTDHRFSITYDTMLTQGQPKDDRATGAAFSVAFVDTAGPKAGAAYANGVQVSVFELARAVKPSEVRGLRAQVEALVDERVAKLTAAEVTEPPSPTTVNGTPGFTVSYTFTRDGVAVSAVSTFLFSGTDEYEVTGQASQADWKTLWPTLEAAMGSFTVL